MIYDATLKKLFQRPPNRLLSRALGEEITVKQILPTELITVENLHPDLLFETQTGDLIHAELQGYRMPEFACRNLIYFGLVLRDYHRPPTQIVFWIGDGNIGVTNGLTFANLSYRYRLIDVRELDGDFLLQSPDVGESIFAILCKLNDPLSTIQKILRRILELPPSGQREAICQLLILSGLRGLMAVAKAEVNKMPVTIDLHENEFFEEIFQEGVHAGRLKVGQDLLTSLLEQKFGPVPSEISQRIREADLARVEHWTKRIIPSTTLAEVFE
jgi:predicted transposase YdaD